MAAQAQIVRRRDACIVRSRACMQTAFCLDILSSKYARKRAEFGNMAFLNLAQERELLLWLAKTANDAKSKETKEGEGARESAGGKRKWLPRH